MKKIRLDKYLVDTGLFESPDAAMRAVLAHKVKVNGAFATSAASLVAPGADIEVAPAKRFVSRGGDKLAAALDAFGIDATGKNCLDIGSSTGGFSDCLLKAGAARVACVDVNYGQLAWEVRQNPRVQVFERTNIKTADAAVLGAPFDIIVIDVSFIGLASLAPAIAALSAAGGGAAADASPAAASPSADVAPAPAATAPADVATAPAAGADVATAAAAAHAAHAAGGTFTALHTDFVGLIKPQFEARSDEVLHGRVTNADVRARVVAEVEAALSAQGARVRGIIESPIKGAKSHNTEYLIWATFDATAHPVPAN